MAISQYATLADFANFGIQPAGTSGISNAVITAEIQRASAEMDSYFGGRWTLPLTAWDMSITAACCTVAGWHVLAGYRGFNPETAQNKVYRQRYDDVMKWLRDVQERRLHPTVTQSSPNRLVPLIVTGANGTSLGGGNNRVVTSYDIANGAGNIPLTPRRGW